MEKPIRLAIFISGGGSTMTAVIDACTKGSLRSLAEVALVVSSKETAGGIAIAESKGIPAVVLNRKMFINEEDFDKVLYEDCVDHRVDAIFQCGWLQKTPSKLIDLYKDRIFNQHPGPLRSDHVDFGGEGMYGINVHAARLSMIFNTDRNFSTEATVHRVTEKYDEGAVVNRKRIVVLDFDTPETVQKRLLPIEHDTVIETIRDLALGRISELPDPSDEEPLILPDEVEILSWAKSEGVKYGKLQF